MYNENPMNKQILFLTLIFTAFFTGCSQDKPKLHNHAEISKLINRFKEENHISALTVLIAVKGEIVHEEYAGLSNRPENLPNNSRCVWPVGSVSKQICAAAVMKCAQQGWLAPDDPVGQYLPGLPVFWQQVSIRQLMNHTSGIKDYLSENLYGMDFQSVCTHPVMQELSFEPGTQWAYSNTGYWIAARIVGQVSGMSYHDFIRKNFSLPLNMHSLQLLPEWEKVKEQVEGYDFSGKPAENSLFDLNSFSGQGDGDLAMSAADLMKWELNLAKGFVLNKGNLKMMQSSGNLKDEKEIIIELPAPFPISYGMGWFIRKSDPAVVWTPGSLPGYSTSAIFLPQQDIHILVFCNKGEFMLADRLGIELVSFFK
jgi:CubicO group peptidase (beta-lactamase class C family)